MKFPNIVKYKQAIQDIDSFEALRKGGVTPVNVGFDPVFASGNFAVVFKMKKNKKLYALKCFLRDDSNRVNRQKLIVDYIKNNPSKYFVSYQFFEKELWVDFDGGESFPVSWMEWEKSPTLGEKISDLCLSNDKKGLKILLENFLKFASWILAKPFAHGDLKHDNLLVKENGDFVLVDYDGMYLPEFKGELTNELGGKSYQHPKRIASFFNPNIDDFSILIIYTSILALSKKPKLYGEFNNGQNIIFDSKDFNYPIRSKLILSLYKVPGLKIYLDAIIKSLGCDEIKIDSLSQFLTNGNNYNFLEIDDLKETLKDKEIFERKLLKEIDYKENSLIQLKNEIKSERKKFDIGIRKMERSILLIKKKLEKSESTLTAKTLDLNKSQNSLKIKKENFSDLENKLKNISAEFRKKNNENNIKSKENEQALRDMRDSLNRAEKMNNKFELEVKNVRKYKNGLIVICYILMVSIVGLGFEINSKYDIINRLSLSKPISVSPVAPVNYGLEDSEKFYHKGLKKFANGDFLGAIYDINKAIDLKPKDDRFYTFKGNCYYSLFDFQNALSDFNRSIGLNDNNTNGFYGKANCYYELDEFEIAVYNYSKAISLESNCSRFYNSRGECYLFLGKYKKAKEDFQDALKFDPDNQTYMDNLNRAIMKI